MGGDYYDKKNYSTAIEYLKKSLNYGKDGKTYMYLGFAQYANNKTYDAKSNLRKAIKLNPKLKAKYPSILQILDK